MMRRDICFGAKATPKPTTTTTTTTTKMRENWDHQPHDSFSGNKLISSLLTKYPSRFQSRWAAVKFARGLFREGTIKSVSYLTHFEDSDQLYTWQHNDADIRSHKMKSNETTTSYQSHTGRKRHEQEDIDIIKSVRAALCQPKQNVSLLNNFFKDLQQDFPDTKTHSDKTSLDQNLINPRLSTASSDSSADAISHNYPKLRERPLGKYSSHQMGSNGRNYSSIPEENMQILERSHGGSSLEYEMSHDNQMSSRRWQDTQFCYSDNEKQLIEEMKKMKRDHNESIQAYEERITKLMAKMHELRGIAEMLENSSTKSSPYGLLPGRANLISLLNSKQEKKPPSAAPTGFVPPPLPPRPGKGSKVYPNKPIVHPKCKMKHLDWSRIILNDGSETSLTTLWHTMSEPKIDFEELERLFRCFGGAGYNLYDDIVNRRGKSKQQYVTLLTSDQSRRLVNTMKILPCDLPTALDGITAMDYHVVQSDRFIELIELLASCNEIEKVLYHVKRKGTASIDHPEFFIAEISKVDHFKDRLDFMRFKKKVQWHLFEIDQQLRELHTACDEISNSTSLKNLLETVLTVGNYMNGGTEEGQADGFTIDTLNKLKETQDQDGKTNLLEFVLKMYCHLYESEVEISCPTRFRLPEPSNMRHAAQVSFDSIQDTLDNLHGEVKSHKEKVADQLTQNGNNENVVQIRTACDNFHTSALEMISEEERLLNDTKDVYQKTSAYFLYNEVPNKPQNFFQIWAVFLHDCKYFWKLAHRRIAKERFELEFRYKGQMSMGASHGFDNYRANMFRHLITLRNNHDFKDNSPNLKLVNNWMEPNESNIKSEKSASLFNSYPTDSAKQTPYRSTSPKPFTSDPPDSATVHKPQPVKSGSTPPHYENQNELDKFMHSSKTDPMDDEKSGNSEKTDKSQFSFKSWLKREPGKRHNSGESKSSGEEKRSEQSNDNIKRQAGETTLSKLRHTVVQKFSGSSSSSSKQRTHQALQNANVTTENSFQTPPSYVPLNLNVNDIDPYETSLGRESRFGTLNSEIDFRPKPFDKDTINNLDFQVNSAERRSKFDASKFNPKGIKCRQGSDISTEYASLYHTPPFSSPPVTHIDKDGYASPITLNAVSKNDINNNETKLRTSGRDVPPRNRAPLALGSNTSISDAYRRTDPVQKDNKRLKTDKTDRVLTNSINQLTFSSKVNSTNYPKDTPTGRHTHSRDHMTHFSENRYTTNQSNIETNVKTVYQPGPHSSGKNSGLSNNHLLQSYPRPQEPLREPPPKPERNLERYAGSQNLSIHPDFSLKDVRSSHQNPIVNDQNINSESRSFLSKKGMNRPPITSLIKRFEQDNEQDSTTDHKEQTNKMTMLSTSTPLTPRRPMTLHDDDDDDPPPLPPRYDIHSAANKFSHEANQNFNQLSGKNERTPIKSVHTRENTGVSEQDEGYKDRLRKAANSAVFERYKPQSTPSYNRNVGQTPQYGRQGSNQSSQFSQQSSLTPASLSSRPYPRQEDTQFSSPQSLHSVQTPQSQTRKPGLGRFGNISMHQTNSDNRSSIHL